MSRSYLLYIEFNVSMENWIWSFFTKWCGHDQIFKVRYDDESCDGYAYVEMGCSSGVQPLETMYELRRQLNNNRFKDVYMRCWDMHQDKSCETLLIDNLDKDEHLRTKR